MLIYVVNTEMITICGSAIDAPKYWHTDVKTLSNAMSDKRDGKRLVVISSFKV